MQPVSLTIANELAALPVVQATVNAFVRTAGAEEAVAAQLELVVEEIVTNIIKFEYLPGQLEWIALELGIVESRFQLTLRFKGIPFDIGYLHRCEQVSMTDILTGEARGIGLHLVRQFSDELQYRNLGKEGQEIRIRRTLTLPSPPAVPAPAVAAAVESPAVPQGIIVRRMRSEESATISKLAYFAYNYSYVYEHIYDPQQVCSLNGQELLLSFVAVDAASDEIIGHCALIPDPRSGLDELGVAFVNPGFRGGGCLNILSEQLIAKAHERGSDGVFAIAVTSHPYSQKSAVKHGLRESALLVSRVQPVSFQAINDQAASRESLLFMTRLFGTAVRGPYHAPHHHLTMLENICVNLGVTASFVTTGPEVMILPPRGELDQSLDHYQAGHIHLHRYGDDSLAQVRRILRDWRLDRLETVYLYLPLSQPATAWLTASFEEMGFFFSGLHPNREGNDRLVLQALNNQRHNYAALHAATPFGQQLIDYVRGCDPDGS